METIDTVATLLGLVGYLWGVVGLINPGWARLPNRGASVGLLIGSVFLLLIGRSLSGPLFTIFSVLAHVGFLALAGGIWGVVGLINPGWARLPNRGAVQTDILYQWQ